jgi:peptidoglycan/LPS O-acetylase OafA/YrhL
LAKSTIPTKKEIQGLNEVRAFGLILVLIYHLFGELLPGGFMGVDVFFVFSGYLITSHLINEYRDHGKIQLLQFYKRRLLRLYPAMICVVLVTLSLSLLLASDFRAGIRIQSLAALGWFTNFYEIIVGGSYENALLPHLFVHTWTLALEMHFYLIWGFILSLALKAKKTDGHTLAKYPINGPRKIVLAVSIILGVGTFATMQYLSFGATDPSYAYYATYSHFYPLMVGAIVALFFGHELPVKLKLSLAAGRGKRGQQKLWLYILCNYTSNAILIAFCLILIACLSFFLNFNSAWTYRIGILLTSLATAFAIVLIRFRQEGKTLKKVKLLDYLGIRSYGIYLYHWIFWVVCSRLLSVNATLAGIVALLLSIATSELSYRFVESRFRHGLKRAPKEMTKDEIQKLTNPKNKRSHIGSAGVFKQVASVAILFAVFILPTYSFFSAPAKSSMEMDFEREALYQEISKMRDTLLEKSGHVSASANTYGTTVEEISSKVTLIGDSVALGARSAILEQLPNAAVDVAKSRSMQNGYEMLQSMQTDGSVRDIVVLALETNLHQYSDFYVEACIRLLGDNHKIVLVTGYGSSETQTHSIFARSMSTLYSNVYIADWAKTADEHKDLLGADNTHLGTAEGKVLYASTIKDAIMKAVGL